MPSQPAIHHVSKRLRPAARSSCDEVGNAATTQLVKKFKTPIANDGATCVNRDGPRVTGLSALRGRVTALVLAGLLAATPLEAALAATPSIEAQLLALQAHDSKLGQIALRLTVANAALCEQHMPGTGAVLHAREQYPASIGAAVEAQFGFATPLAIEAIVPASPAARAGLLPGDGVLAVGQLAPPAPDGDGKPDTLVRDGFEDRLVELDPAAPMVWRVQRGGTEHFLTVIPDRACRARFEIVPGNSLTARNDGRIIQLSSRYFANYNSDELAVIVAHELAHSVLAHRRRLVAAGVSKGLLAEFGRSGRLNRLVEREADRLSVHLLRNAGYDPGLAPQFWDKRGKELAGGLLRGRTHDSPAARAQLMRAEIAAIPANATLPYLPPLLAQRDQPLK